MVRNLAAKKVEKKLLTKTLNNLFVVAKNIILKLHRENLSPYTAEVFFSHISYTPFADENIFIYTLVCYRLAA